MIALTLRIDNLDTLPDGGPVEFVSEERSLAIGRNESLDWALPDPSRFISGTHCEIQFADGAYWLTDVSKNGTFVNGSRQRVKSPYRLGDGDRIAIGHYIIIVAVRSGAGAERDPFAAARPAPASNDIWGSPTPGPAPIDRRDLMPAQRRGQRAPDFSQEFLDLPAMRPAQTPFPAAAEPWGAKPQPGGNPFDAPPLPAPAPAPPAPYRSLPPQPGPLPAPVFSEPFAAEPERPQPPARLPEPVAPRARPQASDTDFLERFAAGAGIDPSLLGGRDAGDAAEEIGRILRIVTENVQQLLKARSAAKVLARSSKRTMLGRVNNPLKFLPTPEEVLEVALTGRRPGYMQASDAFEEALGDLKRHEMATYSAMQAALSRLLADLSPEAIEGKVTGSAFTSRKARNWDMYVARWEAKTEPYENGMLDVFLSYFADAYDEDGSGRKA